ncbi:MAG: hypothetical protein QOD45_139 [Pseudonocardiales bacterium]|jgi:hypothetical protein|nr:hypothetical protein [Pseudonocardiales bacterium]
MNRHGLSELLGTLRRPPDPMLSPDPVVRTLVAQLGTVALPAPRPLFRSELRAQLVAIGPRLVSEAANDRAGALAARSAAGRRWITHPLRVAAGLVVAVALVLGLGVWASQRALPGDALYSLKRAWESTRLAFTHGTDRGVTYLHYASRRADEVSGLLARASASGTGAVADDGVDSHTMTLIDSTLASADSDVREGTRILTDQASAQRSAKPLQILIGWAPVQLSTLHSIEGRLPEGAARDRVLNSIGALTDSAARARVLAPLATCGCFGTLPSDSNGPVPPDGSSAGTPGSPSVPRSSDGSGSSGAVPGGIAPSGGPSGGTEPGSTGPDATLPGLPTPTTTGVPPDPTLPVPTSTAVLPTPTTQLPTSTLPTDLPTGSSTLPLPLPTTSLTI